jgi:hypothetical protein
MPAKKLVRLVSWSRESADRARIAEAAGFLVDASEFPSGRAVGHVRELRPAAVVIDLDRVPSHGRAVGIVLRAAKSTCHIPLVFAGGEAEKIARVRQDLPESVFNAWKTVGTALKKAIRQTPPQPVKPIPYMQQWAGSSLVKKLGFKPASKVALLGAPGGFEEQLGELPDNVAFQGAINRQTDLVIWFVRSRQELEGEVGFVSARLPEGVSIWIAFPKQTGRYRSDFTGNDVRAAGLREGLVDYKVCAIDADWTGLKFARKKTA